MNRYKQGAIAFTILFGLGYLLGAMFNGFDTMRWSEAAEGFFVVWFVFCMVVSLVIIYGESNV